MHHRRLNLSFLVLFAAVFVFHDTGETGAFILEDYPVGPDTYPANVNPLTGLEVSDPSVLTRNPFVVKISNAPPLVRPQAGIAAADLVFEHYAEGGLTRFSAIFYSQAPERVGSIRSARLIDYELMPMFQGLLAFSGASIGVEERLNGSEFANRLFKGVLYGWPDYWRDEVIPVPHNMFANLNALWQRASSENRVFPPALHSLAFDPAFALPSSGSGKVIDLRYRATRVLWQYDSLTGRYHRFADGQVHADANTGEQVTAANIVVIYADHTFTDIVESEFQGNVSYSIEIKLWFEGDAVVFRDGQRYDLRWVRPTREDMIGLRHADGRVFHLKPGNTWFQVMRPPEQQTPEEEWLRVES
jgi:hypothetical protein